MGDDLSAYWRRRKAKDWIVVPWDEASACCWRCASALRLERCHIIPASRGGKNHPSNLIRLCRRCHLEQPNTTDTKAVWQWLRSTRHIGHVRFHREWMEAYETLYGEPPGSRVGGDPAGLSERVLEALGRAVTHWGEAMPNAATLAAAVREAEGL